MPLGVRGFNPIWSEFDLQGKIFDDTFYLFVLENTIPYIPATVYHNADLSGPWTQPIQFLGNGTLPVDVYFESDVFYRLEFRQGPTQNDPLIYEIDNYVAGSGGSTPVDTVAMATDNQITNPQFALVNFSSPFSLSATNPDPIEVAPGWFLELGGTGTVTLNQVALNSTNANPSNAPYALRLTLTGWNSGEVFLRQRFQQNGMLWASFSGSNIKYVSTAITARLTGSPQSISAVLYDSMGAPLTTILDPTAINGSWNEFTGHGQMPQTTNTDTPPAAHIDYKIAIPSNIDIYLSSIQLIVQELPLEPGFEQDSIERQVDHTFHYYKPQLEFKPIPSLLTGWDFPLNPQQFGITSFTNVPIYVWDQTIMCSSVGTINVTQIPATGSMQLTTTNANEAFYMLQYLSGPEAIKTTYSDLSVNIDAYCAVNPGIKVSVFLYYSNTNGTIPPISGGTTIGSITNVATGQFTLSSSGWSLIAQSVGRSNTAILPFNTHLDSITDVKFYDFLASSNYNSPGNTTRNFAIVVTFAVPISGTLIVNNSVSLVPGRIPTRPAPQTQDEVLRECQLYYEQSYDNGSAPFASIPGAVYLSQSSFWNSNTATTYASPFSITYNVAKRAAPTITLYSVDGTINNVQSNLAYFNVTNNISPANILVSSRWTPTIGLKSASYNPTTISSALQSQATGTNRMENSAGIRFQYILDSRLGVV